MLFSPVCFPPGSESFFRTLSVRAREDPFPLLFLLFSAPSRLTSWSIAWTRWKRSANWRGTSLWSWKMILKTDPKRNRFWSWSGKMRWWRLKSRSYSPSFRYKSRLLLLKSRLTHTPVAAQEVLVKPLLQSCNQQKCKVWTDRRLLVQLPAAWSASCTDTCMRRSSTKIVL